eukprot:Awhi_evm1s15184
MTNTGEHEIIQMDRCCMGCVSWPISVPILMIICFLYYSGYLIFWAILAAIGNSEPDKNETAFILGTVMACLTALELPLIILTFYVVSTKYFVGSMLTLYHSIVSIGMATFFVYNYSFSTALGYSGHGTALIIDLTLFFTYFLPGVVGYLICNRLISKTISAKVKGMKTPPSNDENQPSMNFINAQGYEEKVEPSLAKV